MSAQPKTVDRALGKWKVLLPQLGVPAEHLTGKHGSCPLCGEGKDRFRFDDKDGTGSYICNQCGAGYGLDLVMRVNNWGFLEAARAIDGLLGGEHSPSPAYGKGKGGLTPGQVRERLAAIWQSATAPEIVYQYLQSRGLTAIPKELRGHPQLNYRHDAVIGRYPAIVARIIGPDNRPVSIHRTYLGDNLPQRKLICPPLGTIKGAAIRLFEATDGVALCEGIENAIAVRELYNLPAWACCSANGLQSVILPERFKRVVIFGDRDASYTGQSAAYVLAKRLRTEGREVSVHLPPEGQGDWLDILRARRQA